MVHVQFSTQLKDELKVLARSNGNLYNRIRKLSKKLEEAGVAAGQLLDTEVWLYELKSKRPPIRLYYTASKTGNPVFLIGYELKKDSQQQQKTIVQLSARLRDRRTYIRRSFGYRGELASLRDTNQLLLAGLACRVHRFEQESESPIQWFQLRSAHYSIVLLLH